MKYSKGQAVMNTQPIEIPFPVRQHPDRSRIETSTRDWAARFGLVDGDDAKRNLAAARFGEYAAYTHPAAPWPEAGITADWLTWAFLIDDQYEDGELATADTWREIIAAVTDVLAARPPSGPFADAPLIAALADLTTRLYALASPAWQKRFTSHFAAMVAGALREIELRHAGIAPMRADYVELRRDAGAMRVVFDIMEICIRAELSDEVYRDPLYQEIIESGADVVTWTNDLHSAAKELSAGMVTNMVLVLHHHEGMDLPRAAEATRNLVALRVADLDIAVRRLGDGHPARRCAEAVCDWVAGSNSWHAAGTDRYR
ncbi:hypothetical protein FKR81_28365 [Lentzea tibetensis]|uniref:Terpene synthase n=1 Tax=Lentzea tibetensis TaxID=2591470 RepID=A0A563EMX7_9PSEU|nr:hypothetical protein [Lentzea tibetensis]TWP48502.1 hypothetical protein FKR81_28365 [Lentzea tibetensis]